MRGLIGAAAFACVALAGCTGNPFALAAEAGVTPGEAVEFVADVRACDPDSESREDRMAAAEIGVILASIRSGVVEREPGYERIGELVSACAKREPAPPERR